MKSLLFALVAMIATPALADQVTFVGFVNVDQNSTSVSTTDGETSVSSFSWENSFIIGNNTTQKRQVIARVAGCDNGNFFRNRKVLILRVSQDAHKYSSLWSSITYSKTFPSQAACLNAQNQLKNVTFENPVTLDLDANTQSIQ